MYPEQIPAASYTHFNFAFALINPVTYAVAPLEEGDIALYSRLTALKTLNPSLQVHQFPCEKVENIANSFRFGYRLEAGP